MEMVSNSPEDTEMIAVKVLRKLMTLPEKLEGDGATILALSGDLGSGKTAFSQFLGKRLGVKGEIQSPTFVIMKRYPTFNIFFDNYFHIDAYRLESPEEISKLGFADIIANPKNIVVIEWPEKIAGLISDNAFTFSFRHGQNETERLITVPDELSF